MSKEPENEPESSDRKLIDPRDQDSKVEIVVNQSNGHFSARKIIFATQPNHNRAINIFVDDAIPAVTDRLNVENEEQG